MKINMHILFDELSLYNPTLFAGEELSLDLRGVRRLPAELGTLSEDYLYLSNMAAAVSF